MYNSYNSLCPQFFSKHLTQINIVGTYQKPIKPIYKQLSILKTNEIKLWYIIHLDECKVGLTIPLLALHYRCTS